MPHTDALGFGITILLLLTGTFLSRADIASLRTELRSQVEAIRTESRTQVEAIRNESRTQVDAMRGEMNGLRTEMNSRFNALDARIDRIFAELGTFHSIQGEHKAKIDALERKQGL